MVCCGFMVGVICYFVVVRGDVILCICFMVCYIDEYIWIFVMFFCEVFDGVFSDVLW